MTDSTKPREALRRPLLRSHGSAPAHATAWNLRVLGRWEEVEKLEADWKRLTPAKAAPFQTFAWNLAWYAEYGDEYDEILLLLVSQGREVRGILPLYRVGREIRLAGDGICDYQDIVAPTEADADRVADFAVRWLLRKRPDWRFRFDKLSTEGWLFRLLLERERKNDRVLTFSKRFAPCPMVDLGSSREDYLASLSRKFRQDLRRSLRRFHRTFPEATVWIERNEEIGVDQLRRLAGFHASHFRLGGSGPCSDLRLRRLLERVAPDPDVGFQVAGIEEGNTLMAMDFGFARGGRYYGYLTSFDPAFRKYAPGKCLLLERIDSWIHGDGVRELDFLCGDEAYKVDYTGGGGYAVHSLHVYPVTFSNEIRRAVRIADGACRRFAKWALRRLGLRDESRREPARTSR